MRHPISKYVIPDSKTIRDRITPAQKEFHAAIGRLIVNFHTLEHFMAIYLGLSLTDNLEEESVFFVTAQLPFRKLIDCLDFQFRAIYKDKKAIDDFEKLLQRVQQLEDSRNRLVHCCHLVGADGKVKRHKILAKRKKGLSFDNTEFSIEQIHELATEAQVLHLQFRSIPFKRDGPRTQS